MDYTDHVKQLLIQRYSKLSYVSIEKAVVLFQSASMDEVMKKHEKRVVFSIVLIVMMAVALFIQLLILYLYKGSIPFRLLINIMLLMIFQKGLHDNYEIREILKTIKAMGEKSN